MGFWSTIKAAIGIGGAPSASQYLPGVVTGRKSAAGVRVNPVNSMQVAAYYAAIRNISEDIGKIPSWIFKADQGGGKSRQRQHSVDILLSKKPNNEMTPISMKQTVTANALGWGNGYAEIIRNGRGDPMELIPIWSPRVEPKRDEEGNLFYRVHEKFDLSTFSNVGPLSGAIDIPAADMFHITGLGGDGVVGWSVAQFGANSFGESIAAQEYAGAFYGNSASPGGVLEHPGQLSPEARTNLADSWDRAHKGSDSAHKVAILEEGMKFNATSVNPRDAQMIESRKFSVTEIARWFRIPPHKLQDLERATFSNVEEQSIDYLQDTLLPWIIRWEEEIERKLLQRVDLFAKFQINSLLRGDQVGRADYYNKLFQMGAISINEIRTFEDMNPIGPEGDTHYVPLNIAPVGDTENEGSDTGESEEAEPSAPGAVGTESASMKAMPIIEATAEVVCRKERLAVGRARKKFADDAEGMELWTIEFMSSQIDYAVSTMLPVAETVDNMKGVEHNAMDCKTGLQIEFSKIYRERMAAPGSVTEREHLILAFQRVMVESGAESQREENAP
jgi:HK97 family phage portal protein